MTRYLFWGSDAATGSEWYFYDSKTLVTGIVADINPGPAWGLDPIPVPYVSFGNSLLFAGTTSSSGSELWITDGTATGTTQIIEIAAGVRSGSPDQFVVAGNIAFFRATTLETGAELWRTDGTAAGTAMVADIRPGSTGSDPEQLKALGNGVVFTAYNFGLYYSDGDSVSRIDNSGAFHWDIAGDKIFYDQGPNQSELWYSNAAGTDEQMVFGASNSLGIYRIRDIESVNDKIIVAAESVLGTMQLWTSDGTLAGTTFLKDFGGPDFYEVRKFGSELLISANDGIWSTDATTAGTQLIIPKPSNNNVTRYWQQSFATDAGTVISTIEQSNTGGSQTSLWVTDGTLNGTQYLFSGNFTLLGVAGDRVIVSVYNVALGRTEIQQLDHDGNVLNVTVGGGGALIEVPDVANVAPSISSSGVVSVLEGSGVATTVVATDMAGGAALVYKIVGGADAAKFTVNALTGALSFVSAPDFEAPTDSGGDNVYNVTVQVSDGLSTDAQAIAVTVTNKNETPVITSNGAGAKATVNVSENSKAVTTVTATDPDASTTKLFSITGGADAAKFTINATTGVLTFVAPPNFEAPADVGGNNVYDVIVQATDGSLSDSQAIAVNVVNENEAPVITSNGGGARAAVGIVENTTIVTTVTASDTDAGAAKLFSISGGPDAAKFTINSSTGVLSFVAAPNYEAPKDSDGNNVYEVTVRVSDGSLVDLQDLKISVKNVAGVAIVGTASNDTVNSSVTINGQPMPTSEEDRVSGQAGDDTLYGLDGNDTIRGGPGRDVLNGGIGIDTVDFSDRSAGLVLMLKGINNATAYLSGVAEDKVASFENVIGTQKADAITGDGNANNLSGLGGADVLSGAGGRDTLIGGSGNDRLNGGDGQDTLVGGSGLDTFVLSVKSISRDTITDFTAVDDSLEVSAALFGGGLAAGGMLTAAQFTSNDTGAATDVLQRFILNTTDGTLSFDVDGLGGVDAAVIAAFRGAIPTLSINDFLIV